MRQKINNSINHIFNQFKNKQILLYKNSLIIFKDVCYIG
jgi:hypothetical protein